MTVRQAERVLRIWRIQYSNPLDLLQIMNHAEKMMRNGDGILDKPYGLIERAATRIWRKLQYNR